MTNALPASVTDFADSLAVFTAEHVRFVVISGVASVLHGHSREVLDLDLFIDNTPVEAAHALRAAMHAGFFATLPLPLDQVVVMRMLDQRGRRIDLHTRHVIPFEEALSRSELMKIGGVEVPVVTLQDLIQMKQKTRPDDWDLPALLALRDRKLAGS